MPAVPKRHEIREYIKTMLTNVHDEVGDKVYSNRVTAYFKSELPCISIFTRDEEAKPRNMAASQYIRNMSLVIEIHAASNEDLDLKLDEIAEAIEQTIAADSNFGGLATSTLLQSTEIELSPDTTTTAVGALSLVYSITYIK